MENTLHYFAGEQGLPDAVPARYAFGRVVAADALWDWEDGAEDNDIDEFRLQFHNKAGARLTVYLDHSRMSQLHAAVGDLLSKFADAVAAGGGE